MTGGEDGAGDGNSRGGLPGGGEAAVYGDLKNEPTFAETKGIGA